MRVHHVKSARASKKTRRCRCGHEVQPGEAYKWAEPRHGPIKIWCKDHSPKRSELTSSKLGMLYDAQDDTDLSGSLEEIQSALQSVADVAREVAEEYEESISMMPDALQDSSPAAEEMREKIDALNDYADRLEDWKTNIDPEEFDDEDLFMEAVSDEASDVLSEFHY